MNEDGGTSATAEESVFVTAFSDEALEAAARAMPDTTAALSFPSAPTVSILIMCCNND